MSFLFQSLLAIGLPLIALPLIIHLINLRRHRRVQWAAMDFLLESQRRNKKWIFLKQLLLLLLRTAAIALVVFMLAGPILRSSWGRLIGQGTTHHLILLDDSYSMSDQHDRTAFEEASRVVDLLVEQAASRPDLQKMTLLKFSEAQDISAGKELDLDNRAIDAKLVEEVQSRLSKAKPSETDVGPIKAIQAALGLPEPETDETRIVYLLSDFRTRQWNQDTEVRQLVSQLREQAAQLYLVQCVEQTRPNLAITRLQPEAGIRAAGVETWMELGVTNYGDEAAMGVIVSVTQDGQKLPAIQFEDVTPGEEVIHRLRVTFPTAGAHQMQASLENDAVKTDNIRYFACQIPGEFPVLLIDGSPEGDDGFYLSTALKPGGTIKPGWSPQIERPSFLRQRDRLDEFAAICLLDVARLDDSEVEALESYVESGGGLGIFLGPEIQPPFYNERLYREGAGLMPVPLHVPTQLISDGESAAPDVVVSDHPIFRVFRGQRNSFLSVAAVNFYYAVDREWQLPEDGATQLLASLRNGAPYVVGKQFGEGRVVVQLSKLSPQKTELGSWGNWSLNPVFPVYANELVGHLSSQTRTSGLREVGEELRFELPEADYLPEVRVRMPHTPESQAIVLTPQANKGLYTIDVGQGELSGVWQFDLQPREADPERRLLAVNVATGEGDLHHLDRSNLAEKLKGIDYEFSLASQMTANDDQLAGFRLSDTMLYLLLGILIAEQWLAYVASYHTRTAAKS